MNFNASSNNNAEKLTWEKMIEKVIMKHDLNNELAERVQNGEKQKDAQKDINQRLSSLVDEFLLQYTEENGTKSLNEQLKPLYEDTKRVKEQENKLNELKKFNNTPNQPPAP